MSDFKKNWQNGCLMWSDDCSYYCSVRNNVVVLFGTLKVQSFTLTEVSDCGLPIVVTSSTFLKRKDMLTGEKAVSLDHQNLAQHTYRQIDFVHLYSLHVYCALVDLNSAGSPGVSSRLLGSQPSTPSVCVCVCACVYTHIHPHTLPPALKIEKTQTTPLSFLLSKITPHAKQQVLS